MGSRRFPGKVLADVGGTPLLQILLRRLEAAMCLDEIVVAVPVGRLDDALADAVAQWGYTTVRGHPTDVLERYHCALDGRGASVVVRVTGDCPLVDPALVDAIVATLEDGAYDYVVVGPSFPAG